MSLSSEPALPFAEVSTEWCETHNPYIFTVQHFYNNSVLIKVCLFAIKNGCYMFLFDDLKKNFFYCIIEVLRNSGGRPLVSRMLLFVLQTLISPHSVGLCRDKSQDKS